MPNYVGRTGPTINNARNPLEQGDRPLHRPKEHRRSNSRASGTLFVADFTCRSLVVQSGCETAAEDYLIHLFRPIQNIKTILIVEKSCSRY